jgi:hypothetical protein
MAESPTNSAQMPKSGATKTIASLGLNIVEAEGGRRDLLLPKGFRAKGDKYPLPTEYRDLLRVAGLPLKGAPKDKVTWAEYIRRARKQANAEKVEHVGVRARERVATMTQAVDAGLELVKEQEERARELVQNAEAKLDEMFTSLDEINEYIKKGALRLARGFDTGEKVNGEPVSHENFLSLTTKVLTHIARTGGLQKPQDKKDSEKAVYDDVADTQRRAAESADKEPAQAPAPDPQTEH